MTKRTSNRLRQARRMLFWLAQAQGDCHWCRGALLPNGHDSDVDSLTVDHVSGNYDHRLRRERSEPAGVRLMHGTCHRSMTLSDRHRYARENRDEIELDAED